MSYKAKSGKIPTETYPATVGTLFEASTVGSNSTVKKSILMVRGFSKFCAKRRNIVDL